MSTARRRRDPFPEPGATTRRRNRRAAPPSGAARPMRHVAGGPAWVWRWEPGASSGRVLMLALTSIGAVLLSVTYPTSRDQIGIVPPLPAGGPVAAGGGPSAPGEPGKGLLTVTGAAVLTQWGTVQVQIAVQDGRILQARGVRYPNLNLHGQALNGAAVPVLNYQAVARQSAHLDTVSGATITSAGYIGSLQSAIDQAHL